MAKQTYSIGGLDFDTVVKINAFLVGGAPAAAHPVPTGTGSAAPPMPGMTAAPPMPAVVAAAPPMPAAVAAAPALPVAAPPAPAAAPGARTILMALSELTAKKGAAVGKSLVQTYTNTYPDGDPKKGSAKFADIHPAHAEAFIAAADAMAAG